jgi:hypothetical protein
MPEAVAGCHLAQARALPGFSPKSGFFSKSPGEAPVAPYAGAFGPLGHPFNFQNSGGIEKVKFQHLFSAYSNSLLCTELALVHHMVYPWDEKHNILAHDLGFLSKFKTGIKRIR